jgi:hypothetical protein
MTVHETAATDTLHHHPRNIRRYTAPSPPVHFPIAINNRWPQPSQNCSKGELAASRTSESGLRL